MVKNATTAVAGAYFVEVTALEPQAPLVKLVWDFRKKSGGHEDLLLYLNGDPQGPYDTWYLADDRTLDDEAEGADAVRAVLRRLLEQWIDALREAADGDVLYLPYDFFDQGIGVLRCEVRAEEVEVTSGSTSLEGWAVMPTDVSDVIRRVDDFKPDRGCIRFTAERDRLLEDLWQNIREVEHMGPPREP